MITKWKICMDNGEYFIITKDEQERLEKFISTRGTLNARWQNDEGSYIFIGHISAIKPEEVLDVIEKQTIKELVEEIKQDTQNETRTDAEETLNRLMELSSCTHESESLFFQETKTGTKYFPVCDKCFRKGRFIKKESLQDDQIKSAIEWVDTN